MQRRCASCIFSFQAGAGRNEHSNVRLALSSCSGMQRSANHRSSTCICKCTCPQCRLKYANVVNLRYGMKSCLSSLHNGGWRFTGWTGETRAQLLQMIAVTSQLF